MASCSYSSSSSSSFSSSSCSSCRARSSLSDDILIEIFTYLPLNSIYKFKCLSKVWLFNLSSPNFIINWFQINKKSIPSWILYHSINYHEPYQKHLKFRKACHELDPRVEEFMTKNDHLFSFKFVKPSPRCKLSLLGSNNGLVLCYGQKKYHVCNPLTQKWVSLPSPPRSKNRRIDASVGIFCDDSSSYTNCFKVVHIPEFDKPSNKFNVDLFCSDLGVWKSFQVSCKVNVQWRQSKSYNVIILNGVLYNIEWSKRMIVYNLNQNNGSGEHRCSVIDLPDEELDFPNFNRRIGESEGWVCYTSTRWQEMERIISVWVLHELNWQILHKDIPINNILTEVRSRIHDEVYTVDVFGFSPVDRNVVLLGSEHWVFEFNILTRSIKELGSGNRYSPDAGTVLQPFVLKPMPTVLSQPSWIDT